MKHSRIPAGTRLPLAWLVTAMLACLLAACDGGGGGGGGGTPTAPSGRVILTPDGGPTPSVSMSRGAGTVEENLELELLANELQDVLTTDFLLTFPPELMAFESARPGDFFGTNASLSVTARSAGELLILLSRPTPVGATGSGSLLFVQFRGVGAGSGRIEIVAPDAAGPGGVLIQGISWLGANVQVLP